MAKRIKIKGKAPRGLSKRARVIAHHWEQSVGDDSPMETWPTKVLKAIEKARSGSTPPSSTRKKRVKEGSRKFIGRRSLKSELREDADTRWRELNSEFLPAASMSQEDLQIEAASARAARKNMGKKLPRLRGQRGSKKFRAQDQNFGEVEGPEFGRGGISNNQRLKALLSKLMDKYYDPGF